jgi:anti-sigma B factor antagonist
MEIGEQTKGAVTVLRPRGPLCDADAENFKRRASEASVSAMGRVVIDASAIPYIDSRGLEVLVDLSEQLGESGQTLRLCAANETLREVLDLTDLSAMFEHYEDVNAAVRSFL